MSAIKKIFRTTEKINNNEENAGSSSKSPSSRKISDVYHNPEVVPPTDGNSIEIPGTSHTENCIVKSKKKTGNRSQVCYNYLKKYNIIDLINTYNHLQTHSSASSIRGVRLRRLMKELSEIQTSNRRDSTFTAELVDDNLFEWHVRLNKIDSESELAADMRELDVPFILLHITFPETFPFRPPFMRVISPRIEKGFVMEGGAICMELLTPRGWASAYTVEAIITQFAASIIKGQVIKNIQFYFYLYKSLNNINLFFSIKQGRIVRKPKTNKEFNRRSAEEAFRSLVKTHEKYGWVTPPLAEG